MASTSSDEKKEPSTLEYISRQVSACIKQLTKIDTNGIKKCGLVISMDPGNNMSDIALECMKQLTSSSSPPSLIIASNKSNLEFWKSLSTSTHHVCTTYNNTEEKHDGPNAIDHNIIYPNIIYPNIIYPNVMKTNLVQLPRLYLLSHKEACAIPINVHWNVVIYSNDYHCPTYANWIPKANYHIPTASHMLLHSEPSYNAKWADRVLSHDHPLRQPGASPMSLETFTSDYVFFKQE